MMAADRADKRGLTDPEVEAELNQLPKMRIVDLRNRTESYSGPNRRRRSVRIF